MNCTIINKTREKEWKEYKPLLEDLMVKTLRLLKVNEDVSISVILVRNKKIHEINRIYRQIDRPTDVISFAICDSEDDYEVMDDSPKELGDVFINVDAVRSQAIEYGHSEKREFCFLFIHGLLHCLGFDHMNKKDEKKMFDLQRKILDPVVPR
ncbi:rRNA maturation RNase YbeY [Anaerorhabdus sp.]|uniref:rRNA maturation RNase YbeY n=1 Tax=Anaerorhabdus sp. TaxID=1872524 RepID=UPI002B2211A9|nr:rRNA maturation RNase YbeY [Anaerorhabdus sp.]MEA4874113.1 rRNA maturation RNase YbeY [Anaerorhabdus sp.]